MRLIAAFRALMPKIDQLLLGRAVVVLLSLGWATTSRGLNPTTAISQYQHDVWTERDGLPQSSVQAITQTSNGYLWVGTRDGLACFDGIKFAVFRAETTAGLRSNDIRALAEDHSGILWVGTFNGGLSCYSNGQFTCFVSSGKLPGQGVFEIVEDRRQHLWINTSGGLAVVRKPLGPVETRFDGLPDRAGWTLHRDGDGEICAFSTAGLFRFSGTRFEPMIESRPEETSSLRKALIDQTGAIWLATREGLRRAKA